MSQHRQPNERIHVRSKETQTIITAADFFPPRVKRSAHANEQTSATDDITTQDAITEYPDDDDDDYVMEETSTSDTDKDEDSAGVRAETEAIQVSRRKGTITMMMSHPRLYMGVCPHSLFVIDLLSEKCPVERGIGS